MLDHINAVSENISHTSHVGGIRISQSRHEMIVDGSDSNFVCRKCGKMVCSMSKCLREMVIYDTATLVEEVCDEFWRSFRSLVMDRQQKRRLQREKKEKREKDGMGTGVGAKRKVTTWVEAAMAIAITIVIAVAMITIPILHP